MAKHKKKKKRPFDPLKIPGMAESFPAPKRAWYNGMLYDMSIPAHCRAMRIGLPPPSVVKDDPEPG